MTGPKIIFTLPILGGIQITETVINAWIVMAFIVLLTFWLTKDLKKVPTGKQVIAEKGVSALYNIVGQVMGTDKLYFAPYMGTLFLFAIISNLVGLVGLRPPTSDINTTAGWALLMFCMVQFFGVKSNGLKGRLKGFAEPIPVALPLNLIGEFSNPIAMAFRLFGNVTSGVIVATLLYAALGALTTRFLAIDIPIFAIGLPAVLSLYFDLFSGVMQAYIIMMLQMVFISMAF